MYCYIKDLGYIVAEEYNISFYDSNPGNNSYSESVTISSRVGAGFSGTPD